MRNLQEGEKGACYFNQPTKKAIPLPATSAWL